MASANEICTGSLRLLGTVQPGRAPSAADMATAIYSFRSMLEYWSTQNLLIYQTTNLVFPLEGGTDVYTLGPTGTWATAFRPMELEYCYLRYSAGGGSPVDQPIQVLSTAQQAAITSKLIASPIPTTVFYNPTTPDATLTFWPVPTSSYEVVLWLLNPLSTFVSNFEELLFPIGYEMALRYNLAVALAPEYNISVRPEVAKFAGETLQALKNRNTRLSLMRCNDYSHVSGRGPSPILDGSRF